MILQGLGSAWRAPNIALSSLFFSSVLQFLITKQFIIFSSCGCRFFEREREIFNVCEWNKSFPSYLYSFANSNWHESFLPVTFIIYSLTLSFQRWAGSMQFTLWDLRQQHRAKRLHRVKEKAHACVLCYSNSVISRVFNLCVGEDPLSDSECDLDSVAGVLKLYFRGLEPPLFPYDSYTQLLECVRKTPYVTSLCVCVSVFRLCTGFTWAFWCLLSVTRVFLEHCSS